jgi:CheY-like chemotaxis protein
MLVDDEKAYIDLLEQLLASHLSCPVYSFSHAADALRALPELDVGLIVTDYNMPDIDGLQLLAEVRQRLPSVPAVMITAYQNNFTEQQLAQVPNLKVVIQKPFKWMILAEHISHYWNGSTPPFPMTRNGN